jgi:long-chain fatty acid transport protein
LHSLQDAQPATTVACLRHQWRYAFLAILDGSIFLNGAGLPHLESFFQMGVAWLGLHVIVENGHGYFLATHKMLRARLPYKFITIATVAAYFGTAGDAEAGAFAIRTQSTSGLGTSFAGIAAGPDLSSIFWNPAGVSIASITEAEVDGALLVPSTDINGSATLEPTPALQPLLGPSVPLSFLDSNGGGIADPSFGSAMYAATPLNERLSIGFGFNAPFGLISEPENENWAGKFEARTSRLLTYNFNPVVSYRVTPSLVLGAGAQVEFAKAELKSAFPGVGGLTGPNPNFVVKGQDFGFGYTLGLIWRALTGTDIGLGFRSSLEHDLDGHLFVAGVPTLGGAQTSVNLEMPEIATASIRQRITPRVTLLGTLEWTNWSILDEVDIKALTSNVNLGASGGSNVTVIPLHWNDGWFFSSGIEYEVSDRTTVRTGVAYEISPIQAATERTARLPDTNRVWVGLGASYAYSDGINLELAYNHIFFEDGSINRTTDIPGLGQVLLLAESETAYDIIAASIKIKLGKPPKSPVK